MKKYDLLCVLVLFVFGSHAQDTSVPPLPDWNGDPKVCTVDPSSTIINDKALPTFPKQAEFTLERVESIHRMNFTLPSRLTMYQYLYDYDANKLILVQNRNGFIDVEYFYYNALKKSTYFRREICVVTDIPTNIDMDGLSAIQTQNGSWHIRPLNDFLLFSSDDPRRPQIRPTYIGQDLIRGIPVDIWESCIISKPDFRTVRRRWAFAQKGFSMPAVPADDTAIPVQANISASVTFPNGTQAVEFDEIFNVHAYRAGIMESNDQLSPPKGVFCDSGPGQDLITLRDAGIEWPDRFSVRVEASSSSSSSWQRFHLRYDRGGPRRPRRIRYDYMPPGAEDYESVIYDFGDNLTFTIDRRVGSCKVSNGVEVPDVDPVVNPIVFFIKHEDMFIFQRGPRRWEYNGVRRCRADSIKCEAVTRSVENFPVIVDFDSQRPTGEYWDGTSVEYGWSVRSPTARPEAGSRKTFDYPVYLFLRMYRQPSSGNPGNVRTQDLEYEFYEMAHDTNPYDFDTSICYRSNNYQYLHVGFRLQLNTGNVIDGNHLDRRYLERTIHINLAETMGIKFSRVSDIEVDHNRDNNRVNILFTLLGQTPRPGTASGVADDEATVGAARDKLQQAIDSESFKFTMTLTENSSTTVEFHSMSGTLRSSTQFMSPFATGTRIVNESYAKSAELGAGFGGILVGLLVGVIIAVIVRKVRKDPMPEFKQISLTNPLTKITSSSKNLPNISFYNKKTPSETASPPPTTTTPTSDA